MNMQLNFSDKLDIGRELTEAPTSTSSVLFTPSMGTESSYLASLKYKPSKEKIKKLGQVFTPQEIANILAIWTLSNNPKQVLDPSVGTGNLLTACHNIDKNVKLYGVELDSDLFEIAKSSTPKGTLLCNANFLTAKLGFFDSIISNPPYVKFHYRDISETEIKDFEELTRFHFSRLTNVYCLFIAKIYALLRNNGRAAIIVPSEFLNANYGVSFKKFLQTYLNPVAILYFENTSLLFEDNLTTSAIILLDKSKKKKTPIPLIKVESLLKLKTIVSDLSRGCKYYKKKDTKDVSKFSPNVKWGNLNAITDNEKYTNKLADFVKCKRGIATGSNDFFCLSFSEILKFHIPIENCMPCITKAQHANGIAFNLNDFDELKKSEQKCFLFYPIQLDGNTKKYIAYGERMKINEKYLTKNRPVWYIPEKRDIGNILIGVFFREHVKYLRNYTNTRNLTCFHSVYADDNIAELIVLFLNSTFGKDAIKSCIRSYGAGLNKLEPKDVESIPCLDFLKYKYKNPEAADFIKTNPTQSQIDNFINEILSIK